MHKIVARVIKIKTKVRVRARPTPDTGVPGTLMGLPSSPARNIGFMENQLTIVLNPEPAPGVTTGYPSRIPNEILTSLVKNCMTQYRCCMEETKI